MRHEFIGEPILLASPIWEIIIRLIPEDEMETKAIENIEITEAERELINNYLLLCISGWSVLTIRSQNGAIFNS